MDFINLARVVVTVASFLAFLAILGYVAYPGNRRRFEAAARLPLDDDDTFTPASIDAARTQGPLR
jgi:cbb3-type cytochrome oxidase subunit 3